jgi:hypothetical protein
MDISSSEFPDEQKTCSAMTEGTGRSDRGF